MYSFFQATKDPYYLQVGKTIIDNLEKRTRVDCGYAGILVSVMAVVFYVCILLLSLISSFTLRCRLKRLHHVNFFQPDVRT